MTLGLEHIYRYAHVSLIEDRAVRLATSNPDGTTPFFFDGTLVRPARAARLLVALMRVVQARFYTPPAMLARILAEADPVVTSGEQQLRFEGFSSCCSVYARVDLLPGSLRTDLAVEGTTNVDFNPPFLAALGRIRDADPVRLSVGDAGVTLKTATEALVERKVRLPHRWLKGLVEVHTVQAAMEPTLQISGVGAARFLKSLPRMRTHRRPTWITPAGSGLRTTQVEPRGAGVRVGGLERLRGLERLTAEARSLRVFQDPVTGASGWVLDYDHARFHLILSPEVWRGFSGEGRSLEALARSEADGARAGFDLATGRPFTRLLPFDVQSIAALQPRIASARKLLEQDAVRFDGDQAWVRSGEIEHRVHLHEAAMGCTCPWFATHRGARGPCKHVLAVQLSERA